MQIIFFLKHHFLRASSVGLHCPPLKSTQLLKSIKYLFPICASSLWYASGSQKLNKMQILNTDTRIRKIERGWNSFYNDETKLSSFLKQILTNNLEIYVVNLLLTPSSLAPGPCGTLSKWAFSNTALILSVVVSTAERRATTFVNPKNCFLYNIMT
jgi:hypothetical protein